MPTGFEPVGLVEGVPVLFEESQYGKPASKVRLALIGRTITLDAGDAELIDGNGGPTLAVRGGRIYALVSATNTMIEFGLDGTELARHRLTGEALGPSQAGYVVFAEGKVSVAVARSSNCRRIPSSWCRARPGTDVNGWGRGCGTAS